MHNYYICFVLNSNDLVFKLLLYAVSKVCHVFLELRCFLLASFSKLYNFTCVLYVQTVSRRPLTAENQSCAMFIYMFLYV